MGEDIILSLGLCWDYSWERAALFEQIHLVSIFSGLIPRPLRSVGSKKPGARLEKTETRGRG
jgi:hypothetical protein